MPTRPIPLTGRIVAGGSRLQTYTTRKLPNGLFLHQRRPHYGWGRPSPGWTIHPTVDADFDIDSPSLGYGKTLVEAATLAKTIRA